MKAAKWFIPCHTDIVRTVDRAGGYFTGVVFLGKVVPCRKRD